MQMQGPKLEKVNFLKQQNFSFVGMTGFEPATTRPPAVYANRTAPHPVLKAANLFILCEFL